MQNRSERRPVAIKWKSRQILEHGKRGSVRVKGVTSRDESLWIAAEATAAQLRPKLKTLYGPEVLGLAVGFRTRGTRPRVHRELVMRFYVARKYLEGERWPAGIRRIPKRIEPRGGSGSKSRASFPTDVTPMEDGSPRGGSASPRIAVRIAGAPGELATLCALVRRAGDPTAPLYALTCRHAMPDLTPGCTPAADSEMWFDETGVKFAVVRPTFLGRWRPSPTPRPVGTSVDGALGVVEDPSQVSSRIGGIRPDSWLSRQSEYDRIRIGLKVLLVSRAGRRTGVVTAKPFMVPFGNYECGTNAGLFIRVARAIEYSVDTSPGDSGSPVYVNVRDQGRTGILAGMHFWGNGGLGYALFMGDVLEQGAFEFPMEVVLNQ